MHWLPFACLLEYGFGQLFKLSQRRGFFAPVVISANYLTLASVLGVYLTLSGRLALTVDVLKVGVVAGCVFICAMTVMTRALERANVAAVLTAFRMAIVVPVAASVWIWGEAMRATQGVGIGLALVALFLMTRGRRPSHGGGAGLKALGVVVPVFLCQGTSHTCLRWVHYAGLDSHLLSVIFTIGLTAGALGAVLVALRRHRPGRAETLMGSGIGLYNLGALIVILTALSLVPGTVFYPVMGCSVVVLDNLSAHFLWKERLTLPSAAGATLAVLAVLMVVR